MKTTERVTGTFDWPELVMRFAYWFAQQQTMPTIASIRARFNVSRATAYRWRNAAHRAQGVTPMKQRQISHAPGTFAACACCKQQPRHYVASGSTQREATLFTVIADRHQLECPCRRLTGWRASLADAVRAWGELGETLPLPLVQRRDNVRAMRTVVKGRAQG